MQERKRILIVTQEMHPYLEQTDIARLTKGLPQYLNESGYEIRVLMPRYGLINERRHRLHEVVRLSGMNIIINNDDYPLIIKVASLPGARLQVYFMDNEEFFKRKFAFNDEKGNFYPDNPERMLFFNRSVIETMRKFNWAPHLIHLHGWMTSLIPLYLRTAYKNDPVFKQSKVVYSVYDNVFRESFANRLIEKNPVPGAKEADISYFKKADNASLTVGGAAHAHGIIIGSQKLDKKITDRLKNLKKPRLEYKAPGEHFETYLNFYRQLLGK
jgi:starch synthase